MCSWYYEELYCVIICLYIHVVLQNLCSIRGPMADHLSVNGLPCINIRNK